MLLPRPNTILRHPWLLPQVLILGLGLTLLSALTTRYFLVRRGRERMEVEATISAGYALTTSRNIARTRTAKGAASRKTWTS